MRIFILFALALSLLLLWAACHRSNKLTNTSKGQSSYIALNLKGGHGRNIQQILDAEENFSKSNPEQTVIYSLDQDDSMTYGIWAQIVKLQSQTVGLGGAAVSGKQARPGQDRFAAGMQARHPIHPRYVRKKIRRHPRRICNCDSIGDSQWGRWLRGKNN